MECGPTKNTPQEKRGIRDMRSSFYYLWYPDLSPLEICNSPISILCATVLGVSVGEESRSPSGHTRSYKGLKDLKYNLLSSILCCIEVKKIKLKF